MHWLVFVNVQSCRMLYEAVDLTLGPYHLVVPATVCIAHTTNLLAQSTQSCFCPALH